MWYVFYALRWRCAMQTRFLEKLEILTAHSGYALWNWNLKLVLKCSVSVMFQYIVGPANRVSTSDVRTNPQTNGSNTGFKPRGREFSFGKFMGKFSFMLN